MFWQLFLSLKEGLARAHGTLDRVLQVLPIYFMPFAIGLVTVIAWLFWDNAYAVRDATPLEIRVQAQSGPVLSLNFAQSQLNYQPALTYFNTRMAETPFWFSFTVPGNAGESKMVEFPSRHALDIACWDGSTRQFLGEASRKHSTGALAPIKAGFALRLPPAKGINLLCRAGFAGPARLNVLLWSEDQLLQSAQHFHRQSGLFDGGMVLLAVFVLLTALINWQRLYLLFAVWLVLNLRVGAISQGWDILWLGQTVPPDWLLLSRTVTIALYAAVTLMLYQTLFHNELARTRYARLLAATQWLCLPLLGGAVILPFRTFLPVMWLFNSFGLLLMTISLCSIVFKARTRTALWYGASLGVTLICGLAEIIAAAAGKRELLVVVNSVTGALASSVLTAVAIALQMLQEQQQRIEAQAKLQHSFEVMPIGLFTLTSEGECITANPALLTMLGMPPATSSGVSWKHFFDNQTWGRLHTMLHAQPYGELEIRSRIQIGAAGPRRFMVKATLSNGVIEGSLQDVTESSKANEHMHFLANHDPLTKVFNRRGIETVYGSAVVRLADDHHMLALAYLDLDRFKLINDLFGYAVGDEVLRQVCERVKLLLADEQELGRVGGDEFIIVLPDTTTELATAICKGIVNNIGATPYLVGDKAFHVRGSIGLIEVAAGTRIKDAMANADRACRTAKQGHNQGLVIYEKNAPAFREREAELVLVERFSASSATDGLFLEMQPIMSLRTPFDSLNFEVLLRMREPDGQLIPAGRIISAAENSGRTGLIDRWVMTTTLAWIDKHCLQLPHTQFICLNLNGASLNDEKFVHDAIALLAQNIHVAGRLCIEITESVALSDMNNTRRFIDSVRSYGCKVALDDFGAGYTSFSYLMELPADVIKIDGSFIVDINANPANIAIVEAIVSLANNLGMKTIAEWAEDCATVQTLAELGVDYVQGFGIARPQAPEQILLASSSASFIQDELTASLVRMLNTSGDSLFALEHAPLIRRQNVH